MISRLRVGISSFTQGITLIRSNRNLLILSAIPAFMSLVLYTVSLVIGMMYLDTILSLVIKSNIHEYNAFLKYLIYILWFAILGAGMYFFVFVIVSVLAVPVCAVLAERTLAHQQFFLPEKKGVKENIKIFIKMLRVSLLKLILILMLSVLVFFASFIPLISPIAIFISVMLITFDCMDYVMELDELGFRQRMALFKNHWIEIGSFSIGMAVILVIPFIHFLMLPVAVVGTTVMYTKIRGKKGNYDSAGNPRINM